MVGTEKVETNEIIRNQRNEKRVKNIGIHELELFRERKPHQEKKGEAERWNKKGRLKSDEMKDRRIAIERDEDGLVAGDKRMAGNLRIKYFSSRILWTGRDEIFSAGFLMRTNVHFSSERLEENERFGLEGWVNGLS